MSEKKSSKAPPHRILAIICFGLFAGAMALNSLQINESEIVSGPSVMWNVFQYGMPLLIGGICLTGQQWAFMTGVIYGTIGLALDIATLAQGATGEDSSTTFIMLILTTGLLNVALITLCAKFLLASAEVKVNSKQSH